MKKVIGILGIVMVASLGMFSLDTASAEEIAGSERCEKYCQKSAVWDCKLTYSNGTVVRCLNAMPKDTGLE